MKNTLFLLLTFNFTFAQQSIKVNYEQLNFYSENFFDVFPSHERETIKKQFTSPRPFELTNNGVFSIYTSINTKALLIPSNDVKTETEINRGTSVEIPKIWLLKDLNLKKNYKKVNLNESEFYVENSFPNNGLIYTNKIKNIENYKCKLAYSIKNNDTIKYWYTEEIPIIDGPFIMNETPGLLLMYETKKGTIYATKIEFFDKKINIDGLDKNISIITEETYRNLKVEAVKAKSYTDENGAIHSEKVEKINNGN